MGRIGMPMMNKTGYSMYWNSMWDDKLNYSRSFKEDVLIKIFFNLFIEGGYLFVKLGKINNMDDYLKVLKSKYNLHFLKFKRENNRYNYILDTRKNAQKYLSRVWLLKYQTWVIFYFFTYSFNLSKFSKKTFKKKRKKRKKKKINKNKQYFNIVSNYYYTLFKIDYDHKKFDKYSLNKSSF